MATLLILRMHALSTQQFKCKKNALLAFQFKYIYAHEHQLYDLYHLSWFQAVFYLVEGKRHDSRMLQISGLLFQLQQHSHDEVLQPLCPVTRHTPLTPFRLHLQTPYRHAHLTADQEAFNTSISKVRSAVEWVFGDNLSYFAFLDFKKNLKLCLCPVGTIYSACALVCTVLCPAPFLLRAANHPTVLSNVVF